MDIHYHLGSFAFIGMKFIVLLREIGIKNTSLCGDEIETTTKMLRKS